MKNILFYLLTSLCLIEHISAQEVNWLQREGGVSYERSQSIIVDQDNFIYITGGYNGNSQIGQQTLPAYGDEDIFISKHDQNGNLEWVVTAGGAEQDLPFSINLDSETNVYVTGPRITLLPLFMPVNVMAPLRLTISGAVAVSIGCK